MIEQFMDTMKEAFIEVFEAVDPVMKQLGFSNVPRWAKITILLSVVCAPAFLIVFCIFWCEKRQERKIEEGAEEAPEEEEKEHVDKKKKKID